MKAELIHIECSVFNGVADYRIGDKTFRFGLCSPNYNDYGEYRVYNEFEQVSYDPNHQGYIPTSVYSSIELSEEQANWWLDDNREVTGYVENGEAVGGTSEGEFHIYNKEDEMVKFSEWVNTEHDSYEHLMYNILNVFYHWYRSEENKPLDDFSVYVYPNQ
jgi:hypothetical protein